MSLYKRADVYLINDKKKELQLIGEVNMQKGDLAYFTYLLHRDNELPFVIPNATGMGYTKYSKSAQLFYFKNYEEMTQFINSNKIGSALDLYNQVHK